MKHIALAVVAAAALALIGPHLSSSEQAFGGRPADLAVRLDRPSAGFARNGQEIHGQASADARASQPAPVSMVRMRAGEAPLSRFDRR